MGWKFLSGNDNEAHDAASNIFLEKMLKLFVMLINIAILILLGRSQRGAEDPGPLPIECCLALLRTNNKQVSDF